MTRWIEHPAVPSRLILAWDAPITEARRTRWAVGEITEQGSAIRFRYYSGDEFRAMNLGGTEEQIRASGYVGYPAFKSGPKGARVFESGVLEAFMRRLTPSVRTDYSNYLEYFCLRPDANLSSLSLLGTTGARLPGDGFSIVDPLDSLPSRCELLMEVSGFRHYATSESKNMVGCEVSFQLETENEFDRHAIAIMLDGKKIGSVNRLQAQNLQRYLAQRNVASWIERVNGNSERPRCFLFVEVCDSAQERAA